MTVTFDSPEHREHEAEIEQLAQFLNLAAESTGAGGGTIIGALTMLLALWLDEAPASVSNEIRDRVVNVLKGHIDG